MGEMYKEGMVHRKIEDPSLGILYLKKGTCEMEVADQVFGMWESDLCLIPPDTCFTVLEQAGGVDSGMIYLSFPKQVIEDWLLPLFQNSHLLADFFSACLYEEGFSSCLRFTVGKNAKIRELPEIMGREQYSPDKYSGEIMIDMLQILLHMLLRDCPDTAVYLPDSPVQEEAAGIIRRISADYANISLKALAAEMGYSVGYCSRYIKQVTGRNFEDILSSVRFQRAEHLLAETDTCLCDISCALGYKNPENFFRSFKKKYGITPGQYRERERTA